MLIYNFFICRFLISEAEKDVRNWNSNKIKILNVT